MDAAYAAPTRTTTFRPEFKGPNPLGLIAFGLAIAAAAVYVGHSLVGDIDASGSTVRLITIILLGGALALALGFEFVNGFHDTANAVATVIYTRSLPPTFAVIWSGVWNFLGVLASTGAVAYSIITLLPVELILQVGSGAGYAMIFALLFSAVIWNVGTWSLGIPNSSSHALIGSVFGVGLANQLMAPAGYATSGVDWSQAEKIGKALLFSPLIGFILAAFVLLAVKTLARNPRLHTTPATDAPPPWWIRATLILTCTSVSFAHGGNDGQKGMGLMMLILIGAVPAAFALNRDLPDAQIPALVQSIEDAGAVFAARSDGETPDAVRAREIVGEALRKKEFSAPQTAAALSAMTDELGKAVRAHGSLKRVPADEASTLRTDFYMTGEAARLMAKKGEGLSGDETATLKNFVEKEQASTRFIPNWVKIAVAIALGLGTMVAWKRIVITIGERIGKHPMTYAQGASAEFVAAATIMAAQHYGLPISTTHALSSGVAGTMAANGSGLRWSTVGVIASAWLITLPVVVALSGALYYVFLLLVR